MNDEEDLKRFLRRSKLRLALMFALAHRASGAGGFSDGIGAANAFVDAAIAAGYTPEELAESLP
jgi:hypothetical protein